MINVDLNDDNESGSCGEVARQLIKTAVTLIRLSSVFFRDPTKVINKHLTLAYWARTSVKESTDGKSMKTVRYDGSFEAHTSCHSASICKYSSSLSQVCS